MALVTVTIRDRNRDQTHTTRIKTTPDMDRQDIADKAAAKIYGPRCFWFRDSGVPGFGQVFKRLRPTKANSEPGNSAMTGRVSLDITE